MDNETKEAVRRVLRESGDAPHFFDLSDAERLNWMIGRGFELGRQHRPKPVAPRPKEGRRKPKPRRVEWKIKKIVLVK